MSSILHKKNIEPNMKIKKLVNGFLKCCCLRPSKNESASKRTTLADLFKADSPNANEHGGVDSELVPSSLASIAPILPVTNEIQEDNIRPPESILDWTNELVSDMANQHNNNQDLQTTDMNQEIYRIKLAGPPTEIGEGKPENQNHAIIFTRGEALQTTDMNQISLFEAKVANGNGEHSPSRDVYRLGRRFGFFRMLTFYFTIVGVYFSSMLTGIGIRIARVHPKTGTPIYATLLITTLSCIISLFSSLDVLPSIFSFSTLFIFMLMAVALLVRRYYVKNATCKEEFVRFLVCLFLVVGSSTVVATLWNSGNRGYVGYGVAGFLWLLGTGGMALMPKQRAPQVWGVPLVPWLPALSIDTNLFAIALEAASFWRFIICSAVMIVYYLFICIYSCIHAHPMGHSLNWASMHANIERNRILRESIMELARAYEAIMGLVIFMPVVVLSWFRLVCSSTKHLVEALDYL